MLHLVSKFTLVFLFGSLTLGQLDGIVLGQAKPSGSGTKSNDSQSSQTRSDGSGTANAYDSNDDGAESVDASISTPIYWAPRSMEMRFGLKVESNDTICSRIKATIPLPRDWPEQSVEITRIDAPDNAQYKTRELPGGTTQMIIISPGMNAQSTFNFVVHAKIKKQFVKLPKSIEGLKKPSKRNKEVRIYFGDSPSISVTDRALKRVAKEISSTDPSTPWEHAEKIYDWVRDNIEYRNGKLRTTKLALREKWGDCEEMSGLFVALCRASKIPARCVWVPNHCYAEFALEDEEGNIHWYPCQPAGERQFGEMNDYKPILQKGDRFKIPEKRKSVRYVAEFFTCKTKPIGRVGPQAFVIRDLGELQGDEAVEKPLNSE